MNVLCALKCAYEFQRPSQQFTLCIWWTSLLFFFFFLNKLTKYANDKIDYTTWKWSITNFKSQSLYRSHSFQISVVHRLKKLNPCIGCDFCHVFIIIEPIDFYISNTCKNICSSCWTKSNNNNNIINNLTILYQNLSRYK